MSDDPEWLILYHNRSSVISTSPNQIEWWVLLDYRVVTIREQPNLQEWYQ